MTADENLLECTLGSDAFWMVNKKIAYSVGMIGAALMADLIAKRRYYRSKGQLDDRGGFFNVADSLEADLTIGEKALRSAKKRLVTQGFIKLKKRGVPAKHYFYIQDNIVLKCLNSSASQRGTTSSGQKGTAGNSQTDTAINKNKQKNKSNNKPVTPDIVKRIFNHWLKISGIIDQLSKSKERHIITTVNQYSEEELKIAIVNMCNDPWTKEKKAYSLNRLITPEKRSENMAKFGPGCKPAPVKPEVTYDFKSEQKKAFG